MYSDECIAQIEHGTPVNCILAKNQYKIVCDKKIVYYVVKYVVFIVKAKKN